MPITPTLSIEEVQALYQELHKAKMQVQALSAEVAAANSQITNQMNIAIILASALFRQLGYIEENRVALVGGLPRPVRVTQELIFSISQAKINDLEWLFPGEAPALGFSQQVVDGQPHLLFKLVPVSVADTAEKMSMQ
jgi:hypothetical protein